MGDACVLSRLPDQDQRPQLSVVLLRRADQPLRLCAPPTLMMLEFYEPRSTSTSSICYSLILITVESNSKFPRLLFVVIYRLVCLRIYWLIERYPVTFYYVGWMQTT